MTWATLPTAGVGVCVLSLLSCHTGTVLRAEAVTGFHCMVSPQGWWPSRSVRMFSPNFLGLLIGKPGHKVTSLPIVHIIHPALCHVSCLPGFVERQGDLWSVVGKIGVWNNKSKRGLHQSVEIPIILGSWSSR